MTPVSPGTATITVTTQDGGYTDYCEVTVVPEAESIPPVISSVFPQDNSSVVPVTTQVIINFDEQVKPGIAMNSVSITGDTVVAYTYSFSGSSLTLIPVTVGTAVYWVPVAFSHFLLPLAGSRARTLPVSLRKYKVPLP